jgi:hypothetical protein
LFPAPILFIITSYLCWQEIGYSFLPGMGVLLLLPVFQAWLGRYFATFRYVSGQLVGVVIVLLLPIVNILHK